MARKAKVEEVVEVIDTSTMIDGGEPPVIEPPVIEPPSVVPEVAKRLNVHYSVMDVVVATYNETDGDVSAKFTAAIASSEELKSEFDAYKHLIVRESRNGYYFLIKEATAIKAAATWDGVWVQPVSYSINA
jgi:hypothetical protein